MVQAGEEMIINLDGRPVARITAVGRRPQLIIRQEFVRRFLSRQADPELRADLDELAADTTDDLPPL